MVNLKKTNTCISEKQYAYEMGLLWILCMDTIHHTIASVATRLPKRN